MTHCAKTLELCDKSRSNIWVVLSSFWSWAEKEPALRIPHVIRGVVQQPLYGKKKIDQKLSSWRNDGQSCGRTSRRRGGIG